jgi:glyoxylase-like metal-dependent hydrolase (beta-lactamase superfamily II)
MGRVIGIVVALLVVVGGVVAIHVYNEINSFEVTRITDDVHMLSGFGSNVGILATERGAVVVDTMTFRMQGEEILERAEELGRGPVQAIVNTHYHLDHTHGNPAFAPGTKVVSTQRTLDYLRLLDGDYWEGDAAATLPNDTFDRTHELAIGDKTVRLLHPGRGHTDGDLVVLFVEDRVLHTGDLLFNGRYPNIDLEAGGSVREWGATLDRVLALDFDRVIPGHGPATDRAGIEAFQRFVRELSQVGERAAREGRSLEETLAEAKLGEDAGYEVMSIPLVMRLDRDFVVRRAWEEATGAVRPVEVPSS